MKNFAAPFAALAALALPLPALAQAAKPCMAAEEAKGLLTFAMPDLIDSVSTSCKSTLAPTAFLTRSGKDMSARYRGEADTAWPTAKRAIVKLAGKDGEVLNALPDEATKALIGATISAELGKTVKPSSCGLVSDVLEQLAPLPPANTANLIGIILEAVGKSGKAGNGNFAICPRSGGTTASK